MLGKDLMFHEFWGCRVVRAWGLRWLDLRAVGFSGFRVAGFRGFRKYVGAS